VSKGYHQWQLQETGKYLLDTSASSSIKNMFANCCSLAVEWVGLRPKKRLRNTPPHQNRSQKLKHSTGGLRFRGVVARRPQKTHTCSALFLFCPPNGVTHTHMHTHRGGAEPVHYGENYHFIWHLHVF